MDDKASFDLLVRKQNADALAIIMRGIVHSLLPKLTDDGIFLLYGFMNGCCSHSSRSLSSLSLLILSLMHICISAAMQL
jgi:hypothetical protein